MYSFKQPTQVLMKEILQTKYLNHKINLACAYSHMLAYFCILHVENVDQEYVAVEEEAAAEDQEEPQLQELEAAEQVEEQEFDLTNPDPQPGKHRFMLNPLPLNSSFTITAIYLCM